MGISLLDTLAALDEANARLVKAIRDGDDDAREEIFAAILQLQSKRDAAMHARSGRPVRTSSYRMSIPLRDHVIRLLSVVSRPVPVRLLSDMSKAMTSQALPTPALSSLRRDEARSWDKANNADHRTALRETYVVSALHADRLSPVRGSVALSHWPLDLRLVSSMSPRVDFLHAAKALAEAAIEAADTPNEQQMRRLAIQVGRAVPGVPAGPTSLVRIVELATRELADLEPQDTAERRAAALRAVAQLDERTQIFGAEMRLVHSEEIRHAR